MLKSTCIAVVSCSKNVNNNEAKFHWHSMGQLALTNIIKFTNILVGDLNVFINLIKHSKSTTLISVNINSENLESIRLNEYFLNKNFKCI